MDKYFASLPSDEIGPEIFRRIDDFYENIVRYGQMELWRRSRDFYYQAIRSGGRVYASGKDGEFTNVDLADYRNILLHLKVLTTNQRPTWEPKATNSDAKSMSQTILAQGLLDYYMREKKLDRFGDAALDYALKYGTGWVELDWNATAGKEFVAGENGPAKEGDVEGAAYPPWDVIIDYTRRSHDGSDWQITRSFQNRWNVAAKYAPETAGEKYEALRSKILSATIGEKERQTLIGFIRYEETDMVPVYTLHHRRSDACPKGRLVRLVAPDAILSDGELPFKNITLYRIAPGELDGSPLGYTVAYDLMALQESENAINSTIATNAATFGVQNICAPKGHGLTITEVVSGLNLIEYDSDKGKPEALNLLSIPAELFKYADSLSSKMEVIAGINSVSRGTPEASLKSGAALALVQSMAIQFNSGLQKSYAQLHEDMGTGLIEILQDFCTTKRVAAIAGKSRRPMMKEWTGADLTQIARVTVDLGNPLSQTTAGRVNLAESLANMQMIENPQQYIQVLSTGRLEPAIEGKQNELLNIKGENEVLADGGAPIAVAVDNHALHIQEHKCVMASPDSREDERIVTAVMNHIQQHVDLLKRTDPNLLMILGQQPIAQAPGPGAPTPGGPPIPGGPEAAGTGAQAPDVGAILTPAETAGGPVPEGPRMPTNPLSGEQFNNATGGIL